MTLPFHLQKLPPEAFILLRYMLGRGASTAEELEQSGLSARMVSKIIRRLINGDYLEFRAGKYTLTREGIDAAKLILEQDALIHEAASPALSPTEANAIHTVRRHISIVMPRTCIAGRPFILHIGVNIPRATGGLLDRVRHVELRFSVTGGQLERQQANLEIPIQQAAIPQKIHLTADGTLPIVRVRVDAFQHLEQDQLKELGGFYFDIPLVQDAGLADTTPRAVGMDIHLNG